MLNIFRSIQIKLALMLAFSAVIGIGLSSIGTFLYMDHQIREEGLDSLEDITEVLSHNLVAAVRFDVVKDIHVTLSSLDSNKDILAVFVYDIEHKLITRYNIADNNLEEHWLLVQRLNADGGGGQNLRYDDSQHMLVNKPINLDNENIGSVSVLANVNQLQKFLYSLIVVQLLMAGLAIILVFFLAFRMQRMFTLPILKLKDAMERFSVNSDDDSHVHHASGDEYAVLCEGFNHMIDVIRERSRELDFQRAALDEHAIVTTINSDGIIIQYNNKFSEVSGYSHEELMGKDYQSILSDAHPLSFYHQIWQEVSTGKVWRGEMKSRAKDGHYYWVYASIVPFMNEQGKPFKYIAVRTDITKRKEAEETMRLARELAEEAAQVKADFLSMMSHEIRTPMNAIVGMTHLALQTQLTSKQHDYLSKTDAASRSLLALINNILDFSKIEAGKMEIESVPFQLEEVLDDLFSVVGLSIHEKGLELCFSIDSNVPLTLLGDPLRLGQILLNLCNNAIKFTSAGEVAILIRCCDAEDANPCDHTVTLEFTVQDTGIGLSESQQRSLFQSFSQADASITRKYGGTGLGLAICKQLIALMDGTIQVKSEQHVGSQFIFTVVCEKDNQEQSALLHIPTEFNEIRALLIDANDTSLIMMQQYLNAYNIHVDTANSAALARTMLKAENVPYQLLFIDSGMAGSIDLLRHIPQLPSSAAAASTIMMASVFAHDAVMEQLDGARLDGFLNKPVTPSTLMDTILSVLDIDGEGKKKPSAISPRTVDLPCFIDARILVVEDNLVNQQIVCEVLEQAGCIVTLASTGQEGVELVLHGDFHLVLMDLQMPGMDGYTATDMIRQHPQFEQLPIIAMTAHAMADEREKCLAHGMNGHASKPIDVPKLLMLIREWIDPKNIANSGAAQAKETTTIVTEPDNRTLLDFDRDGFLNLLGGNEQLMYSIVQKFHQSYHQAAENLRSLLQQQKLIEAQQLIHGVRGTSGGIMAMKLFHATTELDIALNQSIRDGVALPDISALVNAFEFSLDGVLRSIEDVR